MFADSNYLSAPLTVKKIEKVILNNQNCYLVEVAEDITYREGISQEKTFVSKELRTFKHTYKNGNDISEGENGAKYDAFYYFVHYLDKNIEQGTPFRKYFFSSN